MFKQIVSFLFLVSLFSCNPKDCFQDTGKIIQQEITLSNFSKITVGNEITLILKQGIEQSVIIETGENLINEVNAKVIDNRLLVEDNNACNYIRDYAITKVIVTSPNINEIRSNTARDIKSDGVLLFPNLLLISEDSNDDFLTIGDFDLEINNQSLNIVANGNSLFKLKGSTTNLSVGFYAGSSRFEGESLLAENISITHKGTNDILANPQNKITGTIYNLGDVISYNHPSIVNIEELYTGRLIFN